MIPAAIPGIEVEPCPGSDVRGSFVAYAFELAAVVARYVAHARQLYYQIVLAGYACPRCAGPLVMLRDGRCRCARCEHELDPTLAFQACPQCGAAARLRITRYACSRCGGEISSHFLFDGRVFDADYFRARMAEHRQRRAVQRRRLQEMLAGTRSPDLAPQPADLSAVPDLRAALDALTAQSHVTLLSPQRDPFDLSRYEAHVRTQLGRSALSLAEIPAIQQDTRRDLIWRFVAVVFLAHAGVLHIWQERQTIWVKHRETD